MPVRMASTRIALFTLDTDAVWGAVKLRPISLSLASTTQYIPYRVHVFAENIISCLDAILCGKCSFFSHHLIFQWPPNIASMYPGNVSVMCFMVYHIHGILGFFLALCCKQQEKWSIYVDLKNFHQSWFYELPHRLREIRQDTTSNAQNSFKSAISLPCWNSLVEPVLMTKTLLTDFVIRLAVSM